MLTRRQIYQQVHSVLGRRPQALLAGLWHDQPQDSSRERRRGGSPLRAPNLQCSDGGQREHGGLREEALRVMRLGILWSENEIKGVQNMRGNGSRNGLNTLFLGVLGLLGFISTRRGWKRFACSLPQHECRLTADEILSPCVMPHS